jgi:hypothetical protein
MISTAWHVFSPYLLLAALNLFQNLLRMSLYPDHYNSAAIRALTAPAHLMHCLDTLRQTLQCAADITPMPGRLTANGNLSFVGDALHMCRDFEKIKEWADARAKPST